MQSSPSDHGLPSAARSRALAPVSTKRKIIYPLLIILAGLSVRLPLLDAPGFMHDQEQFIVWGFVAREHGVARVYDAAPTAQGSKRLSNYPPVQIFICRALASAYPLLSGRAIDFELLSAINARETTPEAVAAYVLFKWPAVIADLAIALLLYYALRRRASIDFAAAVGFAYALLPSVWHNSAVWGAVDALPILFVLISLELAHGRRLLWMWVFALLAMLTKPQACFFLPIWALISIRPALPRPREALISVAAMLGVLILILLPFRTALDGVWEAYAGAPAFYPFTHLNGFSAWFLGSPLVSPQLEGNLLDHYVRDDTAILAGLSARKIGILGILAVVVFVVLILWRRRSDEASIRWAVRVIPLAFFLLSTQMHERYLYPAVALWAWTATPTPRWWTTWLLLSFCATVNVLWVWIGPFEGSTATNIVAVLHRSWLGIAPGVWCGLVLMGILIVAMIPPAAQPKGTVPQA